METSEPSRPKANADPPGHPAERPALVVGAVTGVQTLVTMCALVPSAIAPTLAANVGVATGVIGYQIAVVYGGAMLTSTVGGSAVRRFGACRVSQMALALCALGAGLAMTAWLPALAVASILIGFGYGLTNPASSHLLERFAGSGNRNLIYSIKQTGVPLGGIAAGLMAPAVTVAYGWPWAFAACSAVSFAALAALQGVRRRWDEDRDRATALARSPWADLRLVWSLPALRRLSIAAFFFAAVQLCLMSFLVALLVDDLAFGLVQAGAVLGAVQASGAAGRVFWGWLADRVDNGPAVLLGMSVVTALAALATTLLGPGAPAAVVVGVVMVFGFTAIGWNGVYLAEVARISPRDRIGSATGGSLAFTFAGVLAGPSAFALTSGAIGSFTDTFALLAVVAAAGGLAVHFARRRTGDGGRAQGSAVVARAGSGQDRPRDTDGEGPS